MNDFFRDPQESEPTLRLSFRDGRELAWGPGTEFDGFRLTAKIGRGGLGEVWKARDLEGNRDVALKFVPRDIQNHEEEMARVDETFQTVHRLHHEHICPMHALRRHPDFGAYLMMDFIDGISLSLYLRHVRMLTLSRTLEILRPLASALDHAHSRKVIHRDIKPGNIMLVFEKNGDGTWNFEELRDVQLIDFGLASEFRQSMTRVSQVRMGTSGTMPYMSPEQFRGEYQDAHSDQYSLGTMAYEMLAGRLPFCADDPMILMNCISNIPPLPLPDQPETVNSALLRSLAKPRTGRFSTCTEFVNALRGETLEEMEQKIYEALREKAAHRARERFDCEQTDQFQPFQVQDPNAGKRMVKIVSSTAFAFRWCPAGTFTMGSPEDEPERDDDEMPHRVTHPQGFWMLETPVTQAMWKSVMDGNPSRFQDQTLSRDQNPVECVNWSDCQEFCRKLSSKFGGRISLPTEAQWEYACRAGTSGAFAGNFEEMAWYASNSGEQTHPVGQKKPNAWGLYDMHGSVWEWCSDWYDSDYYSEEHQNAPKGPSTGSGRVIRGGSWAYHARNCRSANRNCISPGNRNHNLGFRIVLSAAEE